MSDDFFTLGDEQDEQTALTPEEDFFSLGAEQTAEEASKPEAGWLETLGSIIPETGRRLGTSVGSVLQTIEDEVGAPMSVGKMTKDYWKGQSAKAQDSLNFNNDLEGELKRSALSIGSSVGEMGAMLPLAIGASAPITTMAVVYGLKQYADKFTDYRNEGYDTNTSRRAAFTSGTVTGVTSALPFDKLLKPAGGWIKNAITRVGPAEALQEMAEESMGNIAVDYYIGDKPLPSLQQHLMQVGRAGAEGYVGGALAGGGLEAAQHYSGYETQDFASPKEKTRLQEFKKNELDNNIKKAQKVQEEIQSKKQETISTQVNTFPDPNKVRRKQEEALQKEAKAIEVTKAVKEQSDDVQYSPEDRIALESTIENINEQLKKAKGQDIVNLTKERNKLIDVLDGMAPAERRDASSISDKPNVGVPDIVLEYDSEVGADVLKDLGAPETEAPILPAETAQEMSSTYRVPFQSAKVKVKDLQLSKDVPQFKAGADEKGIVSKLEGKFEKLATAPIVVWRRLNGALEVITGRHRLDLAQRDKVDLMDAHIVNEADGFNVQMAKMVDAESNIRDEKGTIRDFAVYHKNNPFLADVAKAKGLTSRKAGKMGYELGVNSTENTWGLFVNGQLTEDQAAAISEAAPKNDMLQREGARFLTKNPNATPLVLKNYIKALEMSGPGVQGTQGSMFGEPDRRASQAIAEKAAKWYAEGKNQITAVSNAIRNPEIAANWGVDVNNPQESAALLESLKAELEMLKPENWNKGNPTMLQKLRADTRPDTLERLFRDQKGVFNLPMDIITGVKAITEFGASKILREHDPAIVAQKKGLKVASAGERSGAERELHGEFFKKNVLGVSPVVGKVIEKMAFARSLAEKSPVYEKIYQGMKFVAVTRPQEIIHEMQQRLQESYFGLKTTERVNQELITSAEMSNRGLKVDESPESLAARGLNPREVEAYLSVRDAMVRSVDFVEQGLMADPPMWATTTKSAMDEYKKNVREFGDKMRNTHYIPFSRYGKYYVYSANADGANGHLSFHEDNNSVNAQIAVLNQQGMTDVVSGNIQKPSKKARSTGHGTLPMDFLTFLAENGDMEAMDALTNMLPEAATGLQKALIENRGFSGKLRSKAFVQGYSTDLKRSISDYLMSLSYWNARKVGKGVLEKAYEAIPLVDDALRKKAERDIEYALTSEEEFGELRKFYAFFYLTRPLTAIVNGTQSIIMTYPKLMGEVGAKQAVIEWQKAAQAVYQYSTNEKKFAETHPELYSKIKKGEANGTFGDANTQSLATHARGLKGARSAYESTGQLLLSAFSAIEAANRLHAGIAAYRVGKLKGLDGAELDKYMEGIILDTQFDYSKANRPELVRGYGALFGTFRLYTLGQMSFIRKQLGQKKFGSVIAMLGLQAALGGVPGLLFGKWLFQAASAMGYSPLKEMDLFLNQKGTQANHWLKGKVGADLANTILPKTALADAVFNGLPAAYTPFNISGSLSAMDLISEYESGVLPQAARLAAGVTLDFPQRIGRAGALIDKGLYWQAGEAIAPPLLAGASKAIRANVEGGTKTAQGDIIAPKTTGLESAWKAIGGTSSREQRENRLRGYAYSEFKKSKHGATGGSTGDTSTFNFRMAQAQMANDYKEIRKIYEDINNYNKNNPYPIKLSDQSIERYKLNAIDRLKYSGSEAFKKEMQRIEAIFGK